MTSSMTAIRTVAFDARYVNDKYHGIGRHAYNLLEALTRLDTNSISQPNNLSGR